MELKEATVTVKKKERREGKKETGAQTEIEKEKRRKRDEITDCNDSVIWQHSQQPYDNHKINSKIKLAIHGPFRELMSSKS